MSLHRGLALLFSWMQIAVCIPTSSGVETSWPEGYEIAERSESPNGRYAVLVPTRDKAAEAYGEVTNALADLKTHRRLGAIRGSYYFPGQNHHELDAHWALDSSWCIVEYGARYGFESLTLVEPHGTTCSQTDLGVHIQKALDAVIARQNPSSGGSANATFRATKDHKILVAADATSNPRSLDDQPSYFANFYGTFDLTTKKWVRSEGRKVDSGEKDDLDFAFSDGMAEGVTFDKEEDRLAWYDQKLNQVYRAVRLILPAERFAAVKKEQIAWLAQLGTRDTITKKCEFMAARINDLRKLVR